MRFLLTRGERAFIERRRLKLTMKQMADRVGRTKRQQFLLEHEVLDGGSMRLESHEQIAIMRRRSGLEQTEFAKILGCSRVWANRLERGQLKEELIKEALERLNKDGSIPKMDHAPSGKNSS